VDGNIRDSSGRVKKEIDSVVGEGGTSTGGGPKSD